MKILSLALAAALVLSPTMLRAQTFEVDFAKLGGPPLSRAKFGVYQTPLVTLPRLLHSIPLLREAGVRDFRYEMGWGKPDVLAHDQISGSAARLTYDFSTVDALLSALQAARVRPLLAMSYCPNPLKTRTEWAAWKDMPSDMDAWEQINRDYARHLRQAHPGVAYEVWNEPDMPEPGGKMFFSGGPEDYARLYSRSQRGLRAGAMSALVTPSTRPPKAGKAPRSTPRAGRVARQDSARRATCRAPSGRPLTSGCAASSNSEPVASGTWFCACSTMTTRKSTSTVCWRRI